MLAGNQLILVAMLQESADPLPKMDTTTLLDGPKETTALGPKPTGREWGAGLKSTTLLDEPMKTTTLLDAPMKTTTPVDAPEETTAPWWRRCSVWRVVPAVLCLGLIALLLAEAGTTRFTEKPKPNQVRYVPSSPGVDVFVHAQIPRPSSLFNSHRAELLSVQAAAKLDGEVVLNASMTDSHDLGKSLRSNPTVGELGATCTQLDGDIGLT